MGFFLADRPLCWVVEARGLVKVMRAFRFGWLSCSPALMRPASAFGIVMCALGERACTPHQVCVHRFGGGCWR